MRCSLQVKRSAVDALAALQKAIESDWVSPQGRV